MMPSLYGKPGDSMPTNLPHYRRALLLRASGYMRLLDRTS